MAEQTQRQKKAAIYARSATPQGLGQGFLIDAQIHECLDHAQKQGYQVIGGQIYEEIWAGTTLDRPQLTKLREAAKLGLFDVLVVSDVGRISRKLEQVLAVIQELDDLGITVESVQEQLTAAVWKFREEIIASVKETERQHIVKRTQLGRKHRARSV